MTETTTWRPRLARGVRLHDDRVRRRTVLLAPERVIALNASAIEILSRCDGSRTLAEIAAELAERHKAPPDVVEADARGLLAGLAERRYVEL